MKMDAEKCNQREMGGDRTVRKINGETTLLSSCSKAVMTD